MAAVATAAPTAAAGGASSGPQPSGGGRQQNTGPRQPGGQQGPRGAQTPIVAAKPKESLGENAVPTEAELQTCAKKTLLWSLLDSRWGPLASTMFLGGCSV